mmetsp:Transcript_13753/g.29992  ORF Transcript_13753/g.29992 Transcript_13753/m.29992 type:complete len:248 (-) Transcript_13753:99-842(-)|eukprot:CAMPEP_0206495228 /NCGR_PEP_ID=MMETSP0324_2-20121206/48326_1 /ASSEMBLY_ACC=CAM_ASM_000836 /TAXON_ID=2866 /ORGANISM="Crypthecodinium cohnii, Strain Seligo" /LENGTH=247 /DNA_ID=CAMNT_0053979289 /DNA_START=138 /DNA_END=881 /DNA_ORIENTATION=-
MRSVVASNLATALRQATGRGPLLNLQRSAHLKALSCCTFQQSLRPSGSRAFAAFSRPQELHRHRMRLKGFGENVSRGDVPTLQQCQDLLKDNDWYARKVAVDAIAKVAKPADEQYLSLLYKHLEDEDIFVREASVDAVAALARQGDAVAVSKVAIRLADEDCFVRARAVAALSVLGTAGDRDTVNLLLDEMLEDGFVPVRKNTIQALEKLSPPGDKAVLDRLQKAGNDADKGVRDLAKSALKILQAS